MRYKTLAAALIALMFASAAFAQPPCSRDGAPSREQIMRWKKHVVDRFATVVYLDAKGEAIAADDFLRALYEKHLPFEMKDQDGRVLTLRLLAPAVTPDCA